MGHDRCGKPAFRSDFAVERFDMCLHRVDAEPENVGDIFIGLAAREPGRDVELAGRKAGKGHAQPTGRGKLCHQALNRLTIATLYVWTKPLHAIALGIGEPGTRDGAMRGQRHDIAVMGDDDGHQIAGAGRKQSFLDDRQGEIFGVREDIGLA